MSLRSPKAKYFGEINFPKAKKFGSVVSFTSDNLEHLKHLLAMQKRDANETGKCYCVIQENKSTYPEMNLETIEEYYI